MPNFSSRMKAGAALLSGVLLLAACGGTAPQPEPQPDEQTGAILGQITPLGQDTLVRTEITAIQTSVDSSGKFGLNLPNAATMTSTYAQDLFELYNPQTEASVFGVCSDVNETAPDDLRVYPINELFTDTGRRLIQDRSQPSDNANAFKYTAWWFSSQDVTFAFKGNCVGLGQIDTTLTFKRGWNAIATENYGDRTVYTVVEQPQTILPWTDSAASLQSLSLSPNILAPWKNSPQYRNR